MSTKQSGCPSGPKGAKGVAGEIAPTEVKAINAFPESVDGLLIIGKLRGRRRRAVKMNDNSVQHSITLDVEHSRGVTRLELWSDVPVPFGLPVVGAACSIPVDVRVFNSKAGAQYRLRVAVPERGEAF